MSGKSNIRWRESDLTELRRIVKNYNAKINRQRKKLIEQDRRYEASLLPEKASVKELRTNIESRREFNYEVDRMSNFIQTGIKFKVDENTRKSLHATVRDFNSKIDRLSKKAQTQGERATLPEKITTEELLRRASSKEVLKADLKTFKGFLKKGAEELVELPDTKNNIKLTRWQKETMEKMLVPINEARERELQEWKETDVKYGGKSADYKQGQARMNDGDFDIQPMNMYTFSSDYRDIRAKFKLMMREKDPRYWDFRTELARINYTETMDQIIGNHPIGKILLKHIKTMPLKDFKRVLKSEDDLWLLLYDAKTKDPHSEEYRRVLEEIWGEWRTDEMDEAIDNYISKKVGE